MRGRRGDEATMTTEQKRMAEVRALVRHLEIYGADQTRWPHDARARFAPLLTLDARARQSLAEARALDRLLGRVPLPSGHRERALRDRIVAAIDTAGNAQPTVRVIEWPLRRLPSRIAAAAPRSTKWQAAALLAASLAMGVYLGSQGGLAPEVQVVVEAVGLETQADAPQLSWLDDTGVLAEGDW